MNTGAAAVRDAMLDLDRAFRGATVAARKMGMDMRRAQRRFARMHYSRGDYHIEKVCQEILAKKPGRDPYIRLIAASDFAEVLDRA